MTPKLMWKSYRFLPDRLRVRTSLGSQIFDNFTNCSHFSQRKAERPSKEELAELIRNTNWTQLGRMFKVSDNSVRKWAKQYGLI